MHDADMQEYVFSHVLQVRPVAQSLRIVQLMSQNSLMSQRKPLLTTFCKPSSVALRHMVESRSVGVDTSHGN